MRACLAALLLALATALPAAERVQVLIDPGHGGADAGVQQDGFSEAASMLQLAQELAQALKGAGVEAQLTREGAEGLSQAARVRLANQAAPLALISLHVNASFQQGAQGPRVFVPAEGPVDEPAAPLWVQAARLRAKESRALGVAVAKALGSKAPRPVQTLKMALFRGMAVPVCIVELGFVGDPALRASLEQADQRQALVGRLGSGIRQFLRESGDAR